MTNSTRPAPVTRFSHMRELVTVPDGRVGRVESIQTTDDKVIFGVTVGVDVVRVEVTRYPEWTHEQLTLTPPPHGRDAVETDTPQ